MGWNCVGNLGTHLCGANKAKYSSRESFRNDNGRKEFPEQPKVSSIVWRKISSRHYPFPPKPIVYNFTQLNAEHLYRHVRGKFWMELGRRKPPPHTFSGQIPTHPNIVKIWHAEMLCKSGTTQYCRIWHTYHDCFTRHNFFIPFGSTSCKSNTVQS